MSAKPSPVCKAILLCDEVTRDPVTHKTSVIGIFTTFVAPSFPVSMHPCTVYLQLIDVIGELELTAEVLDLEDGLVLARSLVPAQFGSHGERTSGEKWLPVNVVLAHAGTYDLVVYADGAEIDRIKFHALTREDRTDVSSRERQP